LIDAEISRLIFAISCASPIDYSSQTVFGFSFRTADSSFSVISIDEIASSLH